MPTPAQIAAGEAHHDPRRPTRRRLAAVRLAAVMRWLHIYLSMFSLAALLFFALTGITLNHPAWFTPAGAERHSEAEGRLDAAWVRTGSNPPAKLEVVEHLRNRHGIKGAVSDFTTDEGECVVTFKGPGYTADAFIDRNTGSYRVSQTSQGFTAVINDLHKGRDTGSVWSVVIDASAIVMTLVSITGLVLLFYLKRRRIPGLLTALIGTLVILGLAVWLVP